MSTPRGFDDIGFALRFRALVESIVMGVLERERPLPRPGRVHLANRFTGRCDVLFPGDTETVAARMSSNVQPTRDANTTGSDDTADVVLVDGPLGNRYVTEVLNDSVFMVAPNLYEPQLWGGGFLNIPCAQFDTYSPGVLPAVGSTVHCGRWDNTPSFGSDGTGFLDLVVHYVFFTTQTKRYLVPIRQSATGGAWRKLAPTFDSGPANDNDFQTEILVDGSGFELRVRRTKQGGGFNPGGFDLRMWVTMDNVAKVFGSELGEEVTVEPTRFYGTDDAKHDKILAAGPMTTMPRQAQAGMTGGGKITWDGSTLAWSQSFRSGDVGKGYHARSGYFEASTPPATTVLPLYSNNGVTTVTCTAAGVPLSGLQSLWYEPPWGDSFGSVSGSYRLVDTVDDDFIVPAHWILVAQRSDQAGTPSLKLGTGEQIDHWRAVTFLNAWTNFGGGTESAAYKMTDGRQVALKGTVAPGTANAAIFTLPADYRPAALRVMAGIVGAAAIQRVDVTSAGNVSTSGAGALTYLSLDLIKFYV